MHESLLKEIGLTNGETKVYLSLIKMGENTVGPIAKEASVSLSKIYEILENLIKKGLVSHIKRNNTKYFLATDPERIIDYLEGKKKEITDSEEEIRGILPSLKAQQEKNEKKTIATLYEGIKGIKSFYESVLRDSKSKEEILVIGLPKYAAERHEGYFLDWNKRRARKGIGIKLLFNYNVRDLGKKREKIKLTEVKYLTQELVTPAWILICKKGVATIHLTKDPICTFINDEEVVKSYKKFFDLLWQIAKK
tara:strand:- start:5122 stop:5874 length:753 start_codon:yes stop_codon:yes gene_type:complete